MIAVVTRTDIAELFEGAGWTAQAAGFRDLTYLDEPDPDELTEREQGVERLLSKVEEQAGKHTEDCWRKHAGCLAERTREEVWGWE